jgi:hypothetical protein
MTACTAVIGGLGDDKLYGGTGQDKFVYRSGDGNDEIMDFEDSNDALDIEADSVTYSVSQTEYGKDYVFVNGSVLVVRSNSGHGSQNSGSGNGNSGNNKSGNSGSNDDDELDFDHSGHDNSGSGSSDQSLEDAWSDLLASGETDDPSAPADDAASIAPLAELYDDPGQPAMLGISTIHLNHEDLNLIT